MSNSVKEIYTIIINNSTTVLITSIVSFLSYLTIKNIVKKNKIKKGYKKWAEKAKKAREVRDLKIESFLNAHPLSKVPKDIQNLILASDATTLVSLIKTQTIKAVDALLVYCHRAGTIGKDYNWICDVDFENAYQEAIKADLAIQNKENVGPLIGLPVSIKDQMAMKGCTSTAGFTSLASNIRDFDSHVVSVLRKKGAIPFVRSNIPQGYFSIDSSNFLWGSSLNPWDKTKTTGGSSGGEAGLIAARCSPIGIGSDIGGSIRIPAAFCGIYGFRPSQTRISRHGVQTYISANSRSVGFTSIYPTWGPMCRTAQDVVFISRHLFGEYDSDTTHYNKKFDEESFNRIIDNNTKKLKIGYILEAENFESSEAVKESMYDMISRLKSAGYEVIPFPIQEIRELTMYGSTLLFNAGVIGHVDNLLEGEESGSYYNGLRILSKMQNWKIKIYSKILNLFGQKRSAALLDKLRVLDRKEFIHYQNRFHELKLKFYDYWQKNNFTAIIAPTFPTAAYTIGETHNVVTFNTVTYLFNMLDLPSVSIPVGLVKNTEYNSKYNDKYTKAAKHEMSKSEGLPIAIQIGTLPQQDELALRLMKDIDYYEFDKNYGDIVLRNFQKI